MKLRKVVASSVAILWGLAAIAYAVVGMLACLVVIGVRGWRTEL